MSNMYDIIGISIVCFTVLCSIQLVAIHVKHLEHIRDYLKNCPVSPSHK